LSYKYSFTTTDEAGEEEHWEVYYRRLTAMDWLLCLAPDGQRETPRESIVRLHKAVERMVFTVERDGEEMDLDLLPEEVEATVFEQHPSFRGGGTA